MTNQIKENKGAFEVKLDLFVVKEGEQFVAYCPALELSGYGRTKNAAIKSFDIITKDFFEDTSKKGTLEKVLLNLGWTLKRKNYEPPHIKFEDYKFIQDFLVVTREPVQIPY